MKNLLSLSLLNLSLLLGTPATASADSWVQPVAPPDPSLLRLSGNNDSAQPVLSRDGRRVVFVSLADNLATNDDNGDLPDVFVRDLIAQTTTLVSVNATGTRSGNGPSRHPLISSNGQWVVFESQASDLAVNDKNNTDDVFVRDLDSGRTTLVSATASGTAGNGASSRPVMTPDGRWVVFESQASNLTPIDTNQVNDLFVRDLASRTTQLITVKANGTGTATNSPTHRNAAVPFAASLSDDGRFVAFQSTAIGLVTNKPSAYTNNGTMTVPPFQVYVRDLETQTTLPLSVITNGTTMGNRPSWGPMVSGDGRYVAFLSDASDLVDGADNRYTGLFVTDLQTRATRWVGCLGTNRSTNLTSMPMLSSFSRDGRLLVFEQRAGDFSATGTNQIVVLDLATEPATASTNRCGIASLTAFDHTGTHLALKPGATGAVAVFDLATGAAHTAALPTNALLADLSDTTGQLLFTLSGQGLTADANPSVWNVYLHDFATGQNELISRCDPAVPAKLEPGAISFGPGCLSTNGRWLVFISSADAPALNDTNNLPDIFVRDLWTGTNALVSQALDGASSGISAGTYPILSGDGHWVAFVSQATNLTADAGSLVEETNSYRGLFLRDLVNGTNVLVDRNPSLMALSADGSRLAYIAYTPWQTNKKWLSVWDCRTGSKLWTTNCFDWSSYYDSLSMNADGRYLAFALYGRDWHWSVFLRDLVLNETQLINWDPLDPARQIAHHAVGPVISPDGRFLVFQGDVSSSVTSPSYPSVFLRDIVAGTTKTVATNPRAKTGRLDTTTSLSADGRYVVFAMSADNLTPNDTNRDNDVYVVDLLTQTTNLVSVNYLGTGSGNGRSWGPVMSADGRFVVFRSKASDLVPNDTNRMSDVFLRDLRTGTTTLLSANQAGTGSGNWLSSRPRISANGATVAFQSFATDLTAASVYRQGDGYYFRSTAVPTTDTDGDGLDDAWEIAHFGDLSHDGTADTDGDGQSDLREFQAGTDPLNAESALRGETVGRTPEGRPVVQWKAEPGRGYRVQFKTNLDDAQSWQDLPEPVTVTGDTASVVDRTAISDQRYYRVILVP